MSDPSFQIRGMTKADYDEVVEVIDRWWGGPVAQQAHPLFFYELGDTSLVGVHAGDLAGFLLGFVAPTVPPIAYIHLVGVRPDLQRKGVGRDLYSAFAAICRGRGVRHFKAITTAANEGSRHFHRALLFEERLDGSYAGKERARVIFTRTID